MSDDEYRALIVTNPSARPLRARAMPRRLVLFSNRSGI